MSADGLLTMTSLFRIPPPMDDQTRTRCGEDGVVYRCLSVVLSFNHGSSKELTLASGEIHRVSPLATFLPLVLLPSSVAANLSVGRGSLLVALRDEWK